MSKRFLVHYEYSSAHFAEVFCDSVDDIEHELMDGGVLIYIRADEAANRRPDFTILSATEIFEETTDGKQ